MQTKKGNRLHKKGKVLHLGTLSDEHYAKMIADALHGELGQTRNGTKTVMQWTGASERTVKHWFAGTSGPSGHHLVALVSRSDLVLRTVLERAGRMPSLNARFTEIRQKLNELYELFDDVSDGR